MNTNCQVGARYRLTKSAPYVIIRALGKLLGKRYKEGQYYLAVDGARHSDGVRNQARHEGSASG